MKNLDFEWITDEFMLYCRSIQYKKRSRFYSAPFFVLSNYFITFSFTVTCVGFVPSVLPVGMTSSTSL